jgi:SSS family solute:Na+ symporter
MLATAISSITFLAYPGSAYAGNWSLLVPGLMLPIAAFFGIKIFVPFYRKAMLVSAYQYLERRFGTLGRVYACLVFSTLSIWRMAIVLFLLALPIKTLTGWESDTTILVCGVVVTTYTVMGGIQAVVWIDVVQGILLMLGGLVTIATVFVTVPGGPLEIFREGWAARKFNLGVSFEWDFCKMTLWVLVLNGLIGNLQEFSSDQTKVQRYCAAKTTQAAQRAAWVCGLGCIPVWVMFMFVGTCLFVYYQNFPDRLASGLRADEIFPHFILTQMPSGLGGLVVAAVMAAAMAIDSSMNATASVLTKDIYENLYFPGKTDKHYLIVGIVISAILGLCMVLGALLLTTIQRSTILEIAFIIGAIFLHTSERARGGSWRDIRANTDRLPNSERVGSSAGEPKGSPASLLDWGSWECHIAPHRVPGQLPLSSTASRRSSGPHVLDDGVTHASGRPGEFTGAGELPYPTHVWGRECRPESQRRPGKRWVPRVGSRVARRMCLPAEPCVRTNERRDRASERRSWDRSPDAHSSRACFQPPGMACSPRDSPSNNRI